MITFVLTAAVLYFFVVLPMNKLAQRRKEGKEPEPKAPSEEVRLLTEIRDALAGGPQNRGHDRAPAGAEGGGQRTVISWSSSACTLPSSNDSKYASTV